MRTPQALAARSLELHRRVAAKIRQHPELLNKAFDNLRRWRPTTAASSLPYLDEWQELLDQGMEVALAKAVEDSEHAACLRRSSPFSGVLSDEERWAVLRAWDFSRPAPGPQE